MAITLVTHNTAALSYSSNMVNMAASSVRGAACHRLSPSPTAAVTGARMVTQGTV